MKLNLTVEMSSNEEVQNFIYFIEEHATIHDWSILTDTNKMYKDDSFFRQISKALKKAKQVRNDYINNHNAKYIK